MNDIGDVATHLMEFNDSVVIITTGLQSDGGTYSRYCVKGNNHAARSSFEALYQQLFGYIEEEDE